MIGLIIFKNGGEKGYSFTKKIRKLKEASNDYNIKFMLKISLSSSFIISDI
jgi:hypothetical protein